MYLITDIDECSTNSHSCDVNAICNNIRGSYTCVCQVGYSGDGRNCSGTLFLAVCVVVVVDLQWYICFCFTESNKALMSNYSK